MSIRIPIGRRTRAAREPIAVNPYDTNSKLDSGSAPGTDPHSERARRPRFGDAFGDAVADAAVRAATGAIAVSFAVVSRKHWPR